MTLEEIVAEIVGGDYEFWKSSGEMSLTNAAEMLQRLNVPDGIIVRVLSLVWHGAVEEYGV